MGGATQQRQLRMDEQFPCPEDQQENPAKTKFTNDTEVKTPTLEENSI